MSSFGENELLFGNRIAGVIRVLDVYRGPTLFPRLTLRLGVSLHEFPESKISMHVALEKYEIRDFHGELRLEENNKAIGQLRWSGPRRFIRSSPYPMENHVELVCDLDWAVVEAIEEHRAGNEAALWVVLWPTAADGSGHLDCEVRAIRAQIPRHRWLEYLEQLTGLKRALIEVVLPSSQSPEFSAAMGHIADGKNRVDRGDFDEAVGACRRAIESMLKALDVQNLAPAIEERLTVATDTKRAKAYAGIISRLKELGNLTIHRSDASGRYARAEAQFVVATTAHMLALLASLLKPINE